MCVYVYIYEKEDYEFEREQKGYMGGFVGRKGKGKMRCILITSKIKEISLKQEKSKHRSIMNLYKCPRRPSLAKGNTRGAVWQEWSVGEACWKVSAEM